MWGYRDLAPGDLDLARLPRSVVRRSVHVDDDAHAVARAAGEVARVDLALWKEGDAVAVAREDLLLRQGRGLLLW